MLCRCFCGLEPCLGDVSLDSQNKFLAKFIPEGTLLWDLWALPVFLCASGRPSVGSLGLHFVSVGFESAGVKKNVLSTVLLGVKHNTFYQ